MSKRVCIEVGHGGSDPGAVNGSIFEKNINLVVSLELKRQLERHGVEAFLSRKTDVNDPATPFFQRLAGMKFDVGVAVHVNAGGGNGFENYCQTNNLKTASKSLCQRILSEVSAIAQVTTRGTKENANLSFVMLMNNLTFPFSYLEMGFIDNPADYARFNTAEKQRNFGVAYAKGILKYLGLAWKSETGGTAPIATVPAPAPTTPTALPGVFYRVQVGAFKEKKNAENLLAELKKKGYEAFVTGPVDGWYRVQIGAYGKKENAESAVKGLGAAGYKAIILTETLQEKLSVGDKVRVVAPYAPSAFAKAATASAVIGQTRFITNIFTDKTVEFHFQLGVKAGDKSSANTTGFARSTGIEKV